MRVLILFAHPFPKRSRVHQRLRQVIQEVPEIKIREIYELYPDFHIDIKKEQKALLEADVLIFQHPLYWYSCPSLMKEWMDTVLEKGFAYGEGGTALHGKYWMQTLTTRGPESGYQREGYNHFTVAEFLRPFEQTARLCGMIPLEPFLVQGVGRISDEELERIARAYRDLIEAIKKDQLPKPYQTF